MLGSSAEHPLGIHLVGPVAAALVLGGYLIAGRVDAAGANLASVRNAGDRGRLAPRLVASGRLEQVRYRAGYQGQVSQLPAYTCPVPDRCNEQVVESSGYSIEELRLTRYTR